MNMIDTSIKTSEDISIFDVVTSPYRDINGERKIGLFVVIYQEELDPNDYNNRNLTALKLTSRDLYANMYRVLVTKEDVDALHTASYLYTNKLSTLLASNCRVVGHLPTNLCEETRKKLLVYLSQVTSQVTDKIIKSLKGGD